MKILIDLQDEKVREELIKLYIKKHMPDMVIERSHVIHTLHSLHGMLIKNIVVEVRK